jgi:hypothetical protein
MNQLYPSPIHKIYLTNIHINGIFSVFLDILRGHIQYVSNQNAVNITCLLS